MCDAATDAGSLYADLQATAELIEEGALRVTVSARDSLPPSSAAGKKSVLASLILYHMDTHGLSKAAAEVKALCEEEYVNYITRLTEARHAAQLARIEYDAARKQVDLVRTYESSRRCAVRGKRAAALRRRRAQGGDANPVSTLLSLSSGAARCVTVLVRMRCESWAGIHEASCQ
jgi:hypothetical protein